MAVKLKTECDCIKKIKLRTRHNLKEKLYFKGMELNTELRNLRLVDVGVLAQ